ncbi:hypothetical protein MAMC_01667 [Methylacidimicrobium cyclopophantes]|uniref:Glycerophosphoryl diester phosphodiesterase membrane domain-containing protein n=1 Tax=Methylacidimicrobium cyclopophantes TaxID=1041766 RepID=A0A5E6MHZ0_9BACT|nr:hypothetical protein [Methylacidimicrobium cyclopophantes]VVM07519.1 hypothetical protein MAMC_01667 [Methylacidimicrobium cyclopophantes]
MPSAILFLQQSLTVALDRLRASFWIALAAGAAYWLMALLLARIVTNFPRGSPAAILSILSSQGLLGILIVGLARFFLRLADGKAARLDELFYGFSAPWKSIAGALFGWVIGIVSLTALLLPAAAPIALIAVLCLLPLLMFEPFLVADDAVSGVTEAFVESFRLGISHYAKALAIAVTVAALFFLGVLLVVGLLINIPICYSLVAVAYRNLLSEP